MSYDSLLLKPFSRPSARTAEFRAELQEKLAGLPHPSEVDVALARRMRAENKGVLPIDGPQEPAYWVDVPSAPADGPGRARRIDPERTKLVYVHVHGGGWTYGAPEHFDGRNIRLANAVGAVVISPQYRLSPEHRWPDCLEDVLAAARYARDLAAELGAPWAIGGESAGGHLSAAALLRLRAEDGLAGLCGALLTYGIFDLRLSPSTRNWGETNLILSTSIVDWFVCNLLGPDGPRRPDAADPIASPLLADLSGLCPALFQIGDADPLLDDTLMMAERWRAAGNDAMLMVWPEAVHGFDYFDDPHFDLPIALESQAEAAAFLRNRAAAARA